MDVKSGEGNIPKQNAQTKVEIDVENHLLDSTIKLTDGSNGKLFSRGPRNESGVFLYNCHLCGVPNLPGERCLQTHIAGRKHQSRLLQPVDAALFRFRLTQRPNKIQMNIAPGEPVPPGYENEVKPVAEIQKNLDKQKSEPLVALEYLMELITSPNKEPLYHCVLCDKRGDPRSIFLHLESNNHRIKFLEKHFPSAMRELKPHQNASLPQSNQNFATGLRKVCIAIEDHYGRLTPSVHNIDDYNKNRTRYLQEVIFEKHFDERTGPKFLDVLNKDSADDGAKANKNYYEKKVKHDKHNKDRTSFVSSISSSSLSRSRSRSRSPLKRFKFDSKNFFRPTYSKSRSRSRSRSRSPKATNSKDKPPNSPNIFSRFKKSPSPRYKKKDDFDFRKKSPIRDIARSYDKKYDMDHDRRKYSKDRSRDRSLESNSRKSLPTPKELSAQATEIGQERYKWEKYRCTLEIAMNDMQKKFKEHEKNPEQHPDYPEEWKNFWNRRYKELLAEKKDPSKHDFKPEWIEFWTHRMKELHNEEKERKVKEIRKKMNLEDEAEEKTDELKKQYAVKIVPKKKSPIQSISISDDDSDEANSKISSASRKRYEKSRRSRSPWSSERERDHRDKDRYRDRSPRHSFSSEISRDKYKDRAEYHRNLEYSQSYDDWAKTYYGPHRSVFIRNVPDKYSYDAGEDDGAITLVSVCRLLTALEDNLGSLGPKVLDLLAKALALEKLKANSSEEMLLNDDNCVFFETVKEKLKGQLMARILHPSKINPIKRAIKNIATLIHQVSQKSVSETEKVETSTKDTSVNISTAVPATSPTDAPIDKVAIAQKIAGALVAQGKTDVTQEQLEELINVYVTMSEAAKTKDKPISTKEYLNDLEKNKTIEDKPTSLPSEVKPTKAIGKSESEKKEKQTDSQEASNPLQSLTDSDLQTLLQNFKDLSEDEQHNLIGHLKQLEATDPVRVENLRNFVNISISNSEETTHKSSDIFGKKSLTENKEVKRSSDLYRNLSPIPSTSKVSISRIIDSDDDDDYSFDDVVRAASKNINSKEDNYDKSSSYRNEEESSNTSRSSSRKDTSLTDTKNIIANLMGSLQKSVSRVSSTNLATSSNNSVNTAQDPANDAYSNNAGYPPAVEDNYNQHSMYAMQQQESYNNYPENMNNVPYYYDQQQNMNPNNMHPGGGDAMMHHQQHQNHNFNNYNDGYYQPDNNMMQMQNNYYQNQSNMNNQMHQQNLIEYPNMRQVQHQQQQQQPGNNIQIPYNNYY